MKAGIFTRTYEVADLGETLRRMTGHGIFHGNLNFSNCGMDTLPDFVPEEKLEEIHTRCAEAGVVMDSLSGTFNMIDPEEAKRKKGCAQFRVQCEAARQLGIPVISLCTGSKNPESKWKWHEDNRSDAAWLDLLHSTEQILRYAEENHIILGVETEASNIINTPAQARRYLDIFGSEYLKIIMDGANLFRPEQLPFMAEVLEEAFHVLGRDIVLAHAKDLRLRDGVDFVAAGEGELDFPLYLQLLKGSGYEGVLHLHGLSEQQVPASLRYLQSLL